MRQNFNTEKVFCVIFDFLIFKSKPTVIILNIIMLELVDKVKQTMSCNIFHMKWRSIETPFEGLWEYSENCVTNSILLLIKMVLQNVNSVEMYEK